MSNQQKRYGKASEIEAILHDKMQESLADSCVQRTFLDEYFLDRHDYDGEAWESCLLASGKKSNKKTLRRDDDREARREVGVTPQASGRSDFPPLTNRGVSKYRSGGQTIPEPLTLKALIDAEFATDELQRGGYDGGISMGFNGIWQKSDFETLISRLESAKSEASASPESRAEILIGGIPFFVQASGACEGLQYRYIVEGAGLKFLIRDKANEKKQDIRIRFGTEILQGRNFYTVFDATKRFLREIGFTVTKELFSRIDMQILIERETRDFVLPILLDHAVAKARKDNIIRNGKRIETYMLGSKNQIQLCIYDKKAEFQKMIASEPVKACQFLKHCMGEETLNSDTPLTRVEFRLGRDALACLEIDTVEDLRNKEAGLVDWLTSNWFRLLEKPKVRGHENTAKTHEIWEAVRKLFARYFPGVDNNEPVEWRKRERVSLEPIPLEKQAAGCLAAALGLRHGRQPDASTLYDHALRFLCKYLEPLLQKTNAVVDEVQILTGSLIGSDPVNYRDAYDEKASTIKHLRNMIGRLATKVT